MFVRCPMQRLNRPVWVRLPLIFRQTTFPPRQFRHDARTVNLRQEAPGELHAWYRATTGEWLGLVSFSVLYASGIPSEGLRLADQLVPAEALRPRPTGPTEDDDDDDDDVQNWQECDSTGGTGSSLGDVRMAAHHLPDADPERRSPHARDPGAGFRP